MQLRKVINIQGCRVEAFSGEEIDKTAQSTHFCINPKAFSWFHTFLIQVCECQGAKTCTYSGFTSHRLLRTTNADFLFAVTSFKKLYSITFNMNECGKMGYCHFTQNNSIFSKLINHFCAFFKAIKPLRKRQLCINTAWCGYSCFLFQQWDV